MKPSNTRMERRKWHGGNELLSTDETGQRYIARARDICTAMATLVRQGGQFIYEFEIKHNGMTDIIGGYNWVRHAGAIWAIGSVCPEIDMRKPLKRLNEQCMETNWVHNIGGKSKETWAKLGGQALAGLSFLAQNDPDRAVDFGLTLQAMRKRNGDYWHKVAIINGGLGKDSGFESEYYTGEALLLRASMTYDASDYPYYKRLHAERYGIDLQHHWMVYALCTIARRRLTFNPEDPIVTLASEYAREIVETMMREQEWLSEGRSTPLACRVEAIAQYVLLQNRLCWSQHPAWDAETETKANFAVALAAVLERYITGNNYVAGSLDPLEPTRVRLDYMQHAASGLFYVGQLLAEQHRTASPTLHLGVPRAVA